MNHDQKVILKIQKSWQTLDPILVLQLSCSLEGFPKKAFLHLDLRQQHFGARLAQEKPEGLKPQMAFIGLMRKHVPTGVISEIFENSSNGDLWLLLHTTRSGSPEWFLRLCKSRPPEMSLISAGGDDLIRTGAKGTFTKRKAFDGAFPSFAPPDFMPMMATLVARFIKAQEETAEIFAEDEKVEDSELDLSLEQRVLYQKLKRRRKTLIKTREKNLAMIPPDLSLQLADQSSHLLSQYSYLIAPNSCSLKLTKEQTGTSEGLVIDLDPDLSAGHNVEQSFIKLKKMRRAGENGLKQVAKIDAELYCLERDLEQLRQESQTSSNLAAYRIRYKIADGSALPTRGKPITTGPYQNYVMPSGDKILVGRNARLNDDLVKSSKSNDYWFHVLGSVGSHVIVPATNESRSRLAEPIKRAAAILALHFSSLRSSLRGEVCFTRVAQLRKSKGAAAGLWTVLRSETIYLKYTADECKEILSWLRL